MPDSQLRSDGRSDELKDGEEEADDGKRSKRPLRRERLAVSTLLGKVRVEVGIVLGREVSRRAHLAFRAWSCSLSSSGAGA